MAKRFEIEVAGAPITGVKTITAQLGNHSEVQIIATIPAGGKVELELAPAKVSEAIYWTGFAADYPPDTFKVIARSHPDVMPHFAILSPTVEHIVDMNVREVKPLITAQNPLRFLVENISSVDAELEVCLGLMYADVRSGLRVREGRREYMYVP